MVKLITNISQTDLPTISNSFIPNGVPGWSTSQAFDYTEYYNKIKGLRSFQQARNKASCKPDENFKIDYSSKRFYNFTDYETRKNVSVYYRLVHPYCQLDNNNPNFVASGNEIYANTINEQGIAGRVNTTPIVPGQSTGLNPTTINRIKGAIPYNKCANFKNGFGKNIQYTFHF
jgi:hypothetical protein